MVYSYKRLQCTYIQPIHMRDYNVPTSNVHPKYLHPTFIGESHKHYVGQKKSDSKEYRMISFIQVQ